jgi:D-arginine dehydrogenase
MSASPAPFPHDADFLVVGAGIAGAAAAYWLAPHGRVVLLEREAHPGMHSTGRSAALYMESYGTPQVRALTSASRAFLTQPPASFAAHPLLTPRGALMVAAPGQEALLDAHWDVVRAQDPQARRLDMAATCALVPVLRPERVAGSVLEPGAADMDVHAIHDGYLRGARAHGARLVCDAELTALRHDGSHWHAQAAGTVWRAPVVLNAAGAWADIVGQLAGAQPIGLQACRRSAMLFDGPAGMDCSDWPMVYSATEEGWYIKPDAGLLLGSPANADPVPPQDVQPEELDIALAIHRIEHDTLLRIVRPRRTWAGLRSFVADGDLVAGFDGARPGFFWVAAQGGYGIQTSAAMGQACAALARGLPLPPALTHHGLTPAMLSPARLRTPAPG